MALLVILVLNVGHLHLIVPELLTDRVAIDIRRANCVAVVLFPVDVNDKEAQDNAKITKHTDWEEPEDTTAPARLTHASIRPLDIRRIKWAAYFDLQVLLPEDLVKLEEFLGRDGVLKSTEECVRPAHLIKLFVLYVIQL